MLEHVIATPDLRDKVIAFFNDEDTARTSELERNILALPGIDSLKHTLQIRTGEVERAARAQQRVRGKALRGRVQKRCARARQRAEGSAAVVRGEERGRAPGGVKARVALGFDQRDAARGRERRGDTGARHAGPDDDKIEHVSIFPDDSGRRAVRNDCGYDHTGYDLPHLGKADPYEHAGNRLPRGVSHGARGP